jgi:hypothetical protein
VWFIYPAADSSVRGMLFLLRTSKERTMTTLKSDQQKSNAAAQKAERERDQAQALRDYEAEKRAAHANMMRLRVLRLAKERADAQTTTIRIQANKGKVS